MASRTDPFTPRRSTMRHGRRFEDQLAWYEGKSASAKPAWKRVKLVQIVVAAAIPVLAGADVSTGWLGGIGAFLVVLEASQQLNQWRADWILYRSTSESLKHERFLYLAHAGPYTEARDSDRVFAERVEGLVSQEHARWTQHRGTPGDEGSAPPPSAAATTVGR